MLLIILCLISLSVLFCVVFYNQLSNTVRTELRQRSEVFTDNTSQEALDIFTGETGMGVRITLISSDGVILYDSTTNAGTMPNHLDRAEVKSALENGYSEIRRFSETLGEETYYYAVRIADGNILRISKDTSSILGIVMESLPYMAIVVFAVIILGYIFAGSITKRIVDPINKVEINADMISPYEELAPFIRTISQQREHIETQMEELRDRTNTIEAIMHSMHEGMIIVNEKGAVLSVNKSAEIFFDMKGEITGKNILELFRNLDLIENVRKALSDIRCEMNIEHGELVYRAFFSPVQNSGAIIIFLDITERVNVERLRREFSANVSHELKTPLTTIYGNAEMLSNGMVKSGDEMVFHKKIQDETSRMITLIDDIILISKLDESASGIDEFQEDVSLDSAVCEAISVLSQKSAEKNITINFTPSGVHMTANRSQIYELFFNLIDNGIKYNKQSGKVDIDICNTENNKIEISVSDTGIGIPKDAQNRVFERFYRVDKSRSKATGGTGLGLAIVKHIVLAHKGKIQLESDEGKGTAIRINFN
jgi:Signal transduction histidine kinase